MIKEKIRSWIWKLMGLPENVQKLMDIVEQYDTNVVIYPVGDFTFGMITPDGDHEPITFPTPQERAAFGAGVARGVAFMGGQASFLTKDQLEENKLMDQKATTKGDPSKVS